MTTRPAAQSGDSRSTAPQRLTFESGLASDVGRVRRVNEDAGLLNPQAGLWAVCDGMGGHSAGQMASARVVEGLKQIGRHPAAFGLMSACLEAINEANRELAQIGRQQGAIIGTTVVVLMVHAEHFACFWAGDSRIYRMRDGNLAQLTRDHSEIEDLIAHGILTPEEARTWPRRNVITRAVGVDAAIEVDRVEGTLRPGDVFLLCSDGLTNHLEDDELATFLSATGKRAQAICDALVATTLERGAKDNVTVVVVRVHAREPTVLDLDPPAPAPPGETP